MALPRYHRLQALVLALTCWGATAWAQPLTVHSVSKPSDATYRFPWVQGSDAAVAARINDWLYLAHFDAAMPARPEAGLVHTPAGVSALGFEVLRNDTRVLTVRLHGEWCAIHCSPYGFLESFDARTGRHLSAQDLLSLSARQRLAKDFRARNAAKLQDEIRRLRDSQAESKEEALAMYESCWRERQQDDYGPAWALAEMGVGPQSIRFVQPACSTHVNRDLDTLGEFTHDVPLTALSDALTPYGQAVLRGAEPVAEPSRAFGQVLRGQLDGKLDVTVRLEPPSPDGYVRGQYHYVRYRTPIILAGVWNAGTLTMDEQLEDVDPKRAPIWRLRWEGERWQGHWTQGSKRLSVQLAP